MLRASDDLEFYCQVRLLVDGTTLVVYVGERAAFSGRIHDRREGELGLFVTLDEARFDGVRTAIR